MNIKADLETFFRETGWTQRHLATVTGVNEVQISDYKHGRRKPSSAVLERLWPYLYGPKRPAPQPEEAA